MSKIDLPKKIEKKLDTLLETEDWRFGNSEDNYSHYFISVDRGHKVAGFYLKEMAGNCGIYVLTSMYVNDVYARIGLGTLINTIGMHITKSDGYTILMCTIIEANEPMKKILAKNGWELDYTFINKRTNNLIGVYHIKSVIGE